MRKVRMWAAAATLAPMLGLGGCSKEPATPAQTFHEIMAEEIDPGADVLWEIGNRAIGDQAGIDPDRMTDDDWARLAEGAEALRTSALKIATMDPIVLTRSGVPIGDEGAPLGHSSAEVQANIDKDPQNLRDMANALASHTADIATAAREHDAARAGPLIDQLDGVCESCHLTFWYPEEKAFVEEFQKQAGRPTGPRP